MRISKKRKMPIEGAAMRLVALFPTQLGMNGRRSASTSVRKTWREGRCICGASILRDCGGAPGLGPRAAAADTERRRPVGPAESERRPATQAFGSPVRVARMARTPIGYHVAFRQPASLRIRSPDRPRPPDHRWPSMSGPQASRQYRAICRRSIAYPVKAGTRALTGPTRC